MLLLDGFIRAFLAIFLEIHLALSRFAVSLPHENQGNETTEFAAREPRPAGTPVYVPVWCFYLPYNDPTASAEYNYVQFFDAITGEYLVMD